MTEIPEHERTAFEALYAQHYWALLRYAVRRMPDRESARDLVADAFATAWQRRDRMPPDRVLPWLYRIAGNLLANRRRRTARATDAVHRLMRSTDDRHTAGADEQVEWAGALHSVLSDLRSLRDRDREVLMLHAWEGLQGGELAAALGCSTGTAAVRLHRARSRLRKLRDARQAGERQADGRLPHRTTQRDGATT